MTEHITVHPTAEFCMLGDVMCRAWHGQADDGTAVVALISAVRAEGELELPGLVPIPPPDDWSPAVRAVMARLWQLAGQMSEDQAATLLRFVEGMMR